ncbi:MAG: hypothetical protein C4557_11345 [Anaerolineaceae bacterium]|nr:MAG: hypothetical protein C4557_11345 [Anaerolineaceae bacterium]
MDCLFCQPVMIKSKAPFGFAQDDNSIMTTVLQRMTNSIRTTVSQRMTDSIRTTVSQRMTDSIRMTASIVFAFTIR